MTTIFWVLQYSQEIKKKPFRNMAYHSSFLTVKLFSCLVPSNILYRNFVSRTFNASVHSLPNACYWCFTSGHALLLKGLIKRFTVNWTKRSLILKQSWKLEVCLSISDLFVRQSRITYCIRNIPFIFKNQLYCED